MVPSRSGCLRAASLLLLGMHGSLAAQGGANASEPRAILRLGTAAESRAELMKTHGGAAVALEQGLRWLAAHQDKDGRWNSDEFMDHDDRAARTDGAGRAVHDVALTGLAVLAFAREGTAAKPHHPAILRATHWLAQQQQKNGLLGGNQTQDFIYGHAMATLGLWAAAGATGSAEARIAAEGGNAYLDYHRNPYAAWRYQPRDGDSDTSVTTWAVLCYLAAHEQGHKVNDAALRTAAVWFDAVTSPNGHAGYTKAGEGSSRAVGAQVRFPPEHGEAMTAAALLCRMGLGQTAETKPVTQLAANRLLAKPPEWDAATGKIDLCYWFFASEALRHFGGEQQKLWATQLEAALVKGQRVDGAFAGSWDAIDPWGADGGRLYATALAVLSLQGLAPFAPAAPAAGQPK